LTIVFTGEFSLSRDKLTSIIVSNGARNTKSVSKKTSIVVYGSVLEDGRPPE
jgi:NAD-dependent DNA ligase